MLKELKNVLSYLETTIPNQTPYVSFAKLIIASEFSEYSDNPKEVEKIIEEIYEMYANSDDFSVFEAIEEWWDKNN